LKSSIVNKGKLKMKCSTAKQWVRTDVAGGLCPGLWIQDADQQIAETQGAVTPNHDKEDGPDETIQLKTSLSLEITR
jgi:hypothetical protein